MAWPSVTWGNLLPSEVRQEVEQLCALIQGFLSVQHKDDGSHSDITADSIVTEELTVTGPSDLASPVTIRGGVDETAQLVLLDGNWVFDNKVVIGGATIGAGVALEVIGSDGGVGTVSTSTAASREGFFANFLKLNSGTMVKAGVIATSVANGDATSGYFSTNIHTSFMDAGVQRDDVWVVGYGNNGAVFFPPSDVVDSTYAPGSETLTTYGQQKIRKDSIGTNSTRGFSLINATAAAAGAQQYSPVLVWAGRGWKTDATASSQEVEFGAVVRPVQGAAAPTGVWALQYAINGGAFSDVLMVSSTGVVTATTFSGSGASLTAIPASAVTNTAVTLSDTQTIDGPKTFSAVTGNTFAANSNTAHIVDFRNLSSGASARSVWRVGNDTTIEGLMGSAYSSAHSTFPSRARLMTELENGLDLYSGHASGDVRLYSRGALALTLGASQAVRMHAYGAGTATFDASGNITSVSDERYKDRIAPLGYGLAEVLQLSPVRHGYNALSGLDMEGVYGGFLAQNVQTVMPLAVSVNPQGYLTLADRPILGAAITAIHELHTRITALEGR